MNFANVPYESALQSWFSSLRGFNSEVNHTFSRSIAVDGLGYGEVENVH